ncbi:MAG TPA: lytic murein transglycosylase [Actinomycetes bacterium]|nr:lytic murein transglycosylase [Actinomycetes bacterium]
MRLELASKRTKGRHRRQSAPRNEQRVPIPVLAIVAAITLSLIVLSGGSRPAADPPAPAGVPTDESGPDGQASNAEILKRFLDPALLEAVPVGPEPVAEPVKIVLTSARVITTLGESGIPAVALRAYMRAESRLSVQRPSCRLSWTLLAAIGRVESDHGRFGGAQLREDGSGTKPIRGIPLDGRPHVALIRDSDGGALDGDRTYDRAVGPMQFIPSTWRAYAADGNDDGSRDPNNIFDAAQGAGGYLCAAGGDLREPAQAAQAVRRYNNADAYVRVVLSLAQQYLTGDVTIVPSSGDPVPSDRPPATATAGPPATSRPTATTRPTATARPPAPNTPTPRPSTPTPRPTASAPSGTPTAPAPTLSSPAPDQTATAGPSLPTSEPTAPGGSPPASSQSPASTDSVPTVESPETAAVGWAPAMREVVLSLLAAPSATPGAGTSPAPLGDSPGDRPTVAADPARQGGAAR